MPWVDIFNISSLAINAILFFVLASQMRVVARLVGALTALCLNSNALRHCHEIQIAGLMTIFQVRFEQQRQTSLHGTEINPE